MFVEECLAMAGAAKNKAAALKGNPGGYFVASMLAGMYVGFGILLIFSMGGQLAGASYTKWAMGISFGIALSLVIMAGAELFTGNNLIMSVGMMKKTVTAGETAKLWILCYIGNWAGAVLLALMFWGAGLASGATAEFVSATAATKMSIPFWPLFFRAVLCNTLVCLAVWCGLRLKSESGKLIMIFWCLFAFITTGFEHSIANMTLLTVSLLSPASADISVAGYFYNILVVSLGNVVGGILCVALPYHLISRKKGEQA